MKLFMGRMNTLSGGSQNTLTLTYRVASGCSSISSHRYSRTEKRELCYAQRDPKSGRRAVVDSRPVMRVCRHGLQTKRILTRGNHI